MFDKQAKFCLFFFLMAIMFACSLCSEIDFSDKVARMLTPDFFPEHAALFDSTLHCKVGVCAFLFFLTPHIYGVFTALI